MPSKQPVSTHNQTHAKPHVNKIANAQDSSFEKELTRKFSAQQAQSDPDLMNPAQVLQMQQTIGNQATNRVLAGLIPGIGPERDDRIVGGAPDYSTHQGVWVMRQSAGTTAPGNVTISTDTNSGPTWFDHGRFDWRVRFKTTGTFGWIIQEMTKTYSAWDNAGNDVSPIYTPHYWEAWIVDGAGNVAPSVATNNDVWHYGSRGPNTKGKWTIEAAVSFTTIDPLTQGFTIGGARDAGNLLSSTSAPSNPGGVVLNRTASGAWASTGANPTHTGTAGP